MTQGTLGPSELKSNKRSANPLRKASLAISKTVSIEKPEQFREQQSPLRNQTVKKEEILVDASQPNLERKHFTMRRKQLAHQIQLKFFNVKIKKTTKGKIDLEASHQKPFSIWGNAGSKARIETPLSCEEPISSERTIEAQYSDFKDADRAESG